MILQRTLLIAVVFFISCGDKKSIPQGILKPEKMQIVLWDMLRADALTFNFMTRDTSKKPEAENVKLQQLIFAEQKITKQEFYKSFDYYKEHPNLMQPILDSMIEKATREKYKTTQVSAPKQDSAKIAQ